MLKLRREKGFTLIELLIVVVIIGILATVLISKFSGAKASAYLAHANSMANSVAKSCIAYQQLTDGSNATKISHLQKIDSEITSDATMSVVYADGVWTIDHASVTEGTTAKVNATTGAVTKAML